MLEQYAPPRPTPISSVTVSFLRRCELRRVFEGQLPGEALQVLDLLRLRPVRVVLRGRRHDDPAHHRAPHAVHTNQGRLR